VFLAFSGDPFSSFLKEISQRFSFSATFGIGKCYRLASIFSKGNASSASLWMNLFLYIGVYLGMTGMSVAHFLFSFNFNSTLLVATYHQSFKLKSK